MDCEIYLFEGFCVLSITIIKAGVLTGI